LVIHRFNSLANLDGVVHAVSTRHGGVSIGPYASLNLGLHVGDSADAVLENRRRVCEAAGVELDSLVAGAQVLGNAVAWVTEADRGRGAKDQASALPDTDALVTDSPGVVLVAFSADCALVALVDPCRRAIGLAHASRRGTLGHVAARTVRAMQRLFGCQPADLVAAIGPSIGPCCYEVGPEVREQEAVGRRQEAVGSGKREVGRRQEAVGRRQEAVGSGKREVGRRQEAVGRRQEAVGRQQAEVGRKQTAVGSEEQSASLARFFIESEGRIHFDLWAANTAQLVEAGLAAERIEVASICTRCHSDEFFSYRAAGGPTGRFAVLLGMR